MVVIFWIIVYGLSLNLFIFIGFDIKIVEVMSDIYNKTTLGAGAILGGMGGLIYLSDYINKNNWKLNYSSDNYRKGNFKVVQKETEKGKIYILDIKDKTVHHVVNYPTYLDLELNRYDTETLKDAIFNKYIVGEKILTKQPTN